MTFTNFLQVLAFNLLSNTIPLCLLLFFTAYLIIKMYEKRLVKLFAEIITTAGNRKQQLTNRDYESEDYDVKRLESLARNK